MNDLPGRGDVNPYGIPVPNPHEREGPEESERKITLPTALGRATAENDRLRAEAARLREALRFYADETNYPALKPPFMQVEAYMGNRARDALARHREASGGE